MTTKTQIAGKFDIVRSNVSGQEFVVESLSTHREGIVYCCVCLLDGRGAAFFNRDITVVRRDPRNLNLDLGTSELARKTTHAVAMANAEQGA